MRRIQQLGAIILLGVLLVGLPLALAYTVGTPLSWTIPTLDSLKALLTESISSRMVVQIITGAAWLVWFHFVCCVILEVINVTLRRGLPSFRIPLSGVSQGIARRLVAAALLGAVAGPMAAGAANAAGLESSSTYGATLNITVPGVDTAYERSAPLPAASVSQTVSPTALPADVAEQLNQATVKYVVQAPEYGDYDCLWDIAGRHLGDSTRWKEIWQLNQNAESGVQITDPDHIEPGWELVMPADAIDLPAPAAPAEPEPQGPAAPVEEAPAESVAPTAEDTTPEKPADLPVEHQLAPATPAPELRFPTAPTNDVASISAEQNGAPIAAAPQGSPVALTAPQNIVQVAHDVVDTVKEKALTKNAMYVVGCGVGGVLAAGLVAMLATRRKTQRAVRQPGQRIALPDAIQTTIESQFRAIHPNISISDVDSTLRDLAVQLRAADQPFPALHGMYVSSEQIDLFCTEAVPPVAPWDHDPNEPMHWTTALPGQAAAQPVSREVADRPYPALIAIGQSESGGLLLLDLETVGALAFTGPAAVANAAQSAAVLELLTSPWTADAHITIVGASTVSLASLEEDSRVRRSEDLDAEIQRLQRHAEDTDRLLRQDGHPSIGAARSAETTRDIWSPEVLVVQGDLTPEQRSTLTDIVDHPGRGVCVLTAGTAPLGRWAVHFDDEAVQHTPGSDEPLSATFLPAGTTIWPQVLPAELLGQIKELIQITDTPATTGPAWTVDIAPAPGGAEATSLPMLDAVEPFSEQLTAVPPAIEPVEVIEPPAPTAPYISILGEVSIRGAAGSPPKTSGHNHEAVVSELIAFLHLHQEPVTRAVIKEQLRARAGTWTDRLVHTRLAMARVWLGHDANMVPYLPVSGDDAPYQLADVVSSDWTDLQNALLPSIGSKTHHELITALRLVRGEPLGGEPQAAYSWAEPLRQEIIQTIVDVAHQCVTRALAESDLVIAREAAAIGRMVDPCAELMWQHSFRVELAAGHSHQMAHIREEYAGMLLANGLEPSVETDQLLAQVDQHTKLLAS